MRQRFFENTLQSKYIQALLSNTYLPIANTISEGDTIIAGVLYVTGSKIVRCTRTGIYGSTGLVEHVRDFHFGYFYPKFTERFSTTANYYDSETHRVLGRYLRALRDTKGIDLLPFYNIFSDEYLNTVGIENGELVEYSMGMKVVKVPIQFNRTYTIAIDSESTVSICPCFLMKDYLLIQKNPDTKEEISVTQKFHETYPDTIKIYNNLSFRDPITYRVDCIDFSYVQYERDFYMLIQLPSDNVSSIVVLEGDHRNHNRTTKRVINAEEIQSMTDVEMNRVMISELSLLQFNNNISYPFSDRLFEYLIQNTIDSRETIGENVKRVQDLLTTFNKTIGTYGVWDNYLRYKIFQKLQNNNNIRHIDLNAFVDKDTERFLQRGE